MKNDIFYSVNRTVTEYDMLGGVTGVLCALSGGADSVVLLHILISVCREYGVSLRAVHVNHGIRGEEAYRDEMFCCQLCGDLGVPMEVYRVDAPGYAKNHGLGLEEAARDLRYGVFFDILLPGEVVATAHNSTDNAETVLFNLIRGSGSRGLSGIPPKRDMVIRPLISVDREMIRCFAKDNGIHYVEDSTNSDTAYTRNFIRAELIPLAKRINPSFERSVFESSLHLRGEDEYLTSLADEFIESMGNTSIISCDNLSVLPSPVFFRVICKMYAGISRASLSAVHVRAIKDIVDGAVPHSRVCLPDNISAVIENRCLSFLDSPAHSQKDMSETKIGVGKNVFADKNFDIFILDAKSFSDFEKNENIYKLSIFEKINFDKIKGDIYMRTRREGDSYRARSMTKTLKRMMSEKKVPLEERERIPVICDNDGIVWVPGFSVADRVYPFSGDAVTYICYCEK